MNEQQIEVITRWMESSIEQQADLRARITATDLVVSCLMDRHPDPEGLLADVRGIRDSLLQNESLDPETVDLVTGHLDSHVDHLEGLLEDG